MTGTWIVDDVRAEVKRGYSLLRVHEFYEYGVTRCDPQKTK
jgi:hypothetical protein